MNIEKNVTNDNRTVTFSFKSNYVFDCQYKRVVVYCCDWTNGVLQDVDILFTWGRAMYTETEGH